MWHIKSMGSVSTFQGYFDFYYAKAREIGASMLEVTLSQVPIKIETGHSPIKWNGIENFNCRFTG